VHRAPNLQAVAGTVVLSLQAGHEPQKVGISGPPTPERLPSGSPQACQLRCLAVWDSRPSDHVFPPPKLFFFGGYPIFNR
jgi:hypothetical protein